MIGETIFRTIVTTVDPRASRVAYFSMKIGLDARLPAHSVGLGVLVDDTIREISFAKDNEDSTSPWPLGSCKIRFLQARLAHMPSTPLVSLHIMEKNPLNKGIIAENAVGIGTVTPEMVEARARELAMIAGRVPPKPSQVDYEQAQRELTGGTEMDPEEMTLEAVAESERWDPVPGSAGHQTQDSLGEDEDSEGRSESAQLVEEGIKEAEHDQLLQAARAAQAKDQRDT